MSKFPSVLYLLTFLFFTISCTHYKLYGSRIFFLGDYLIAVLGSQQKQEGIYNFCPHACIVLSINLLHQSHTFVTSGEPSRTNYSHLKSTVCITVTLDISHSVAGQNTVTHPSLW